MTKVKLYTAAQCSKYMSFGLAAWRVGGKVKRQQMTDILVTKISCLRSAAFVWERSHPHATVTAGYVCTVIIRKPDLPRAACNGWNTKKTSCVFFFYLWPLGHGILTQRIDTSAVDASLAPPTFLVPHCLRVSKMDPLCTPEPKWRFYDLVKSSDIW